MMKYNNNSFIRFFAGNYVARLLREELSSDLTYHNLSHTIGVVQGVWSISENSELTRDEIEILELAAWFHDTGYLECYKGHEFESQKIAQTFLRKQNYPDEKTKRVLNCIAATKMPHQPVSLLEKVICDADLYHLSLTDYGYTQQRLREEWSKVLNLEFSDEEWINQNLKFLEEHRYFTSYGQKVLQKGKIVNIWRYKELHKIYDVLR